MKVDWKVVSQSAGYVSIKKCYAGQLASSNKSHQRHGQGRSYDITEAKKLFAWIISRAIHYAYHKQTTVDVILNEWESKRTYSWRSYYGDQTFPKLNKTSEYVARPNGKTYYLKDRHYRNRLQARKNAYCDYLKRKDADCTLRKGSKSRWSKLRKLNQARYKRSP